MKLLNIVLIILFAISSSVLGQDKIGHFKNSVTMDFEMNYFLRMPENSNHRFPLIVFLHGAGERGNDISKVKVHGPLKNEYQTFTKDFAILAPQCPEGQYWDVETVYRLILSVLDENPQIDRTRIYLTGLSMGGWGTWRLAEKHPELFAAVVTVCAPAGLPEVRETHFIKNIPIRIYHGALDDVVPVDQSIQMFKELKKIGADVNLTIFENDNHNSWDSTYSNPELYEWLKNQKLKN